MGRANNSTPIAAGKAANTVVRGSPGVLQRIIVTATGTNPMQVFDSNSGASGTIIAALPASPAIGPYEFEVGCNNGIVVAGSATNPGVTIVWD